MVRVSEAKENRPGGETEAVRKSFGGDTLSIADPDPAGLVDGVYVVVVHSRPEGRAPRWTRRIYMSLHAADKARSRASMRGDRAYLVLCQLQAVDTRLGGAL
ncbi:hypothetical protein GCM10009670_04150 [Citricoccus alkalitolerans]